MQSDSKSGDPMQPAGQTPPFEIPDYLAEVVSSVNDGAKSAQAGVFAFTFVAVYLLGVAFSTTDLDFLLDRTMQITQIDVQLPVVFSFVIAPIVFLFLHLYTLVRYDLLGANLEQFRRDLDEFLPQPVAQERCRQLLANIEFVQANASPPGSPLYSRAFAWITRFLIAGLPVIVFLVLQTSALRFQNIGVTNAQRICFFVDLAALVWFFYRQDERRYRTPGIQRSARRLARLAFYSWAPVLLVLGNLVYLNVAAADADLKMIRYEVPRSSIHGPAIVWQRLRDAVSQPLDALTCPSLLHLGCRYLEIDYQTVMGQGWNSQSIAGSSPGADPTLDSIEGADLRGRLLRFAVFDHSLLYNANFMNADLRYASFYDAELQGARFDDAILSGVYLKEARLQGAVLARAVLMGADLDDARLQAADFSKADLRKAELSEARAEGSYFLQANMQGAHLKDTDFSGADLNGANLSGAVAANTEVGLADLRGVEFPTLPNQSILFLTDEGEAIVDSKAPAQNFSQSGGTTTDSERYYPDLAQFLAQSVAPNGPEYADNIAQLAIARDAKAGDDEEYVDIGCALLSGARSGLYSLDQDAQEGLRQMALSYGVLDGNGCTPITEPDAKPDAKPAKKLDKKPVAKQK
jgi:uncharacterized protein YjbI with pentapeptide repeats